MEILIFGLSAYGIITTILFRERKKHPTATAGELLRNLYSKIKTFLNDDEMQFRHLLPLKFQISEKLLGKLLILAEDHSRKGFEPSVLVQRVYSVPCISLTFYHLPEMTEEEVKEFLQEVQMLFRAFYQVENFAIYSQTHEITTIRLFYVETPEDKSFFDAMKKFTLEQEQTHRGVLLDNELEQEMKNVN